MSIYAADNDDYSHITKALFGLSAGQIIETGHQVESSETQDQTSIPQMCDDVSSKIQGQKTFYQQHQEVVIEVIQNIRKDWPKKTITSEMFFEEFNSRADKSKYLITIIRNLYIKYISSLGNKNNQHWTRPKKNVHKSVLSKTAPKEFFKKPIETNVEVTLKKNTSNNAKNGYNFRERKNID